MTRLTLKNIYVYIPCSFQDMNTDARTHDVFRLSFLKSLQKHRRKCYRGVCVCVCGRGVVRGGTSPRGSPLWAGWRQWNNHRSQFTRERETETAASQGYSGRSEVRRDGQRWGGTVCRASSGVRWMFTFWKEERISVRRSFGVNTHTFTTSSAVVITSMSCDVVCLCLHLW